jgi:hypothetical protein
MNKGVLIMNFIEKFHVFTFKLREDIFVVLETGS